ncbi:MAG TPA: SufE family protein [Pirellulales bacterium]|jgi:cysteine desulfuration protein SufE|nr:SufE family protein [Pirellulales bacterium]
MSTAATKLDRIVDEFAGLEPRERLELLLEFAEGLPPLPPRYQAEKDRGEHRVHECQTPVFLWVEVNDGQVQVYGDVAPEAPTVKGFVGILVDAFSGSSAEEVLSVQPDLLQRLGLVQALGMMRMRGLQAILFAIRDQVRKAAITD